MITLTQDISRLALHANFTKVCDLPKPKASILHLCDLILASDPEFFSNNGAFEAYYNDQYGDYTDFDLIVEALMNIHAETLLEDNTSGFYCALGHYDIPDLPYEPKRGDYIQQLLDLLLSCSPQHPISPTESIDYNIVDAEFVEVA